MRRELGLAECDRIAYDDDGWDSRVYLVNRGEAVFKFPRSPAAKLQYRREVRLLDALQTMPSNILLPRVAWRDAELEWFGYRGIVGQQLSYCLSALDANTKQAIGHSVGLFLRQLHFQDVDGLPVVSVDGEIAQYQEKYRLAIPALERLTTSKRAKCEAFFFDTLPNQLRGLGGESRLTHSDLGPWNIILTDGMQVGVIDFGDASYQDPSKDFSGFGDEMIFDAALASYGADDRLREKACVRAKALPILDIPFYLGKHDETGVLACLELIRRLIIRGEVSAARPLHPGGKREATHGSVTGAQ